MRSLSQIIGCEGVLQDPSQQQEPQTTDEKMLYDRKRIDLRLLAFNRFMTRI